MRLQLESLKTF